MKEKKSKKCCAIGSEHAQGKLLNHHPPHDDIHLFVFYFRDYKNSFAVDAKTPYKTYCHMKKKIEKLSAATVIATADKGVLNYVFFEYFFKKTFSRFPLYSKPPK